MKFVHPPLDCSKGCSQAARRVHGLLYGYSLAYAEVRPKAETIGTALGYGKSTVYNATAELRNAGLLAVHERYGRDRRRLSSRYDVFTPPAVALLEPKGSPSEAQKGRSEVQNARTGIEKSRNPNIEESTTSEARRAKPIGGEGTGSSRRSLSKRDSVSEGRLGELVGQARLSGLRSKFGTQLGKLRIVLAEHNVLEQPERLRAACDALLKQGEIIENPVGYLLGILRCQQRELDGARQELQELEELQSQAAGFGCANPLTLEVQIGSLKTRIAEDSQEPDHDGLRAAGGGSLSPQPPSASHVTTAPASRARSAASDDRASARRNGEPEKIEDTLRWLKDCNPTVAKILKLQLESHASEKVTPDGGHRTDTQAGRLKR